ncbi:MAG: Hsp20/alpha crystallin family protein [Candidatus Peribacteraceae bacterium]|nr:Hsp20/alpha crystallin family protein [Candidatus Peribacteraceae bacterium]MDD5074564.1 Hsp20/alpha crystallin family protein [Candidatus Peribacteraceae bacterium]
MGPSPFHGIFSSFGSSPSWDTDSTPAVASRTPATVQLKGEEEALPKAAGVGQIAVDIYEQENYYIIRAPLAGVKLSELDIEVDDKVLTIRGKRAMPESIPANQYYLQECFWGEFARSITLPCAIDPKKVKATFNKDCILKVLVPKEERVKVVRISEGG